MAELDPTEYREVVYEWSLRDFIIWTEEVWLADEFKKMEEEVI